MNQITSKLGISRLCLISFILLYGVFTIERAFSHRIWDKECAKVKYDRNDNSINIRFLFYDFCPALDAHAYLRRVDFHYREDGIKKYYLLMSGKVEEQKEKDRSRFSILMKNNKIGEKIQFINCYNFSNGSEWDDDTPLHVFVDFTDREFMFNEKSLKSKMSYMTVKWDLSKSNKRIKMIRLTGFWITNYQHKSNMIQEYYWLDMSKSNLNTMENTHSLLKSEISNNVQVSKDANAIVIKGAETGENIKVYTTTGAQVKSVVANDDVVNIKLPKNQIYIIKAGQAHYKVALCVP